MSRILQSAAAATVLGALTVCAAFQKSNDEGTTEHVLRTYNLTDRGDSVAKLFEKSSAEQVQEYKSHPHNTIALHAAWDEVKRATRIGPKYREEIDKEGPEPQFKMDRRALQRFLGFVEGRLQVAPPGWWQDAVGRAYAYGNDLSALWLPGHNKKMPYSKTEFGLHVHNQLSVEPLADGALEVISGNLSCRIPAKYFDDLKPDEDATKPGILFKDDIGLSAWMDDERCVFTFHGGADAGFSLHCIDRKSSKEIWSTYVGGHLFGGFGGGFFHSVEFRRQGDALYIFGMCGTLFYIEGVSLKDGSSLFHFGTAYESLDDEQSEK